MRSELPSAQRTWCDDDIANLAVAGICSPFGHTVVNVTLTSGASGSSSSPDFPLKLPATVVCFWRFVAPAGFRVRLRFTSFRLNGHCRRGEERGAWIEVDDTRPDISGASPRTTWGRFCGEVRPPTLYSTGNQLLVYFTTNYSSSFTKSKASSELKEAHEGFYMTYGVVKEGETCAVL